MESIDEQKIPVIPQWQGILASVRRRLISRSGLIVAAILAITVGAVFNWSVLVAAGIAPLILGVLPCVAMCALGLCGNRLFGGGNCSKAAPNAADSKADTVPGAKFNGPANTWFLEIANDCSDAGEHILHTLPTKLTRRIKE